MLCPKETAPLVPINLEGRILVGSFSLLARLERMVRRLSR